MTIRSAFALPILIAAMCAATATSASAQVGALVGFNSANLNFEDDAEQNDVNRRTGLVGGVTFNVPIQNVFSVEVDALVGLKGAKFSGGADAGGIKITYFDIPVMARFNIPGGTNTGLHLLFGPSFNFKLNETSEFEGIGNIDDQIETFETAFVFGGGVKIARFRIDGRWGFGLTNLDKFADGGPGVKSQVFSILFGFEL